MKKIKTASILISILIGGLSCNSVSTQSKNNQSNQVNTDYENQHRVKLIPKLAESKIRIYGEWNAGDDAALSYATLKGEDGDIFIVSDPSGKILFEEKFHEVHKVYSLWALRTLIPQLVLEFDEGGQDSYVQMLDYQKGKISKIIDETNGANSFGASLVIQPQFRAGINPAKEPFEILLIDFGLPSPAGYATKVFRYDGTKYRSVGKFDRQQAANCKEKLIATN